MSWITDATIIGNVDELDVEFLTSAFPEDMDKRGQSFGRLDDSATDQAGGSKFFCSDVLLAAFNYVTPRDIEEYLSSHKFNPFTNAVMVLEGEEDRHSAVYRISDGGLKKLAESESW